MRQSQVDKLYAGLKDLSEERRGKLDERFRLFQLNREVDDLEQWIAEREVVAGSHELGQDYEHVTVSLHFFTLILLPLSLYLIGRLPCPNSTDIMHTQKFPSGRAIFSVT